METAPILEKLLSAFERYYTITTQDVTPPFNAQAEFHSHGEQYVLVKIAKIADIDSNDFVYFKINENLTAEELTNLAEKAWEEGLKKIKPYYGHRNSDVTLIVLSEKIDERVPKTVKKLRFSKSYKFSLWGWSNFRLIVKELSSNQIYANRLGSDLKKVLVKI